MATNRFLVVAKYAVGSNRGLKDVQLVDARVQGGGIKADLIEDFKGSFPQVRWFHDIGHYDGTPFPGATAVLVDLPASILEANGGVLTKEQIDSIVKHHLSLGVYPVVRFYCTNTGHVMHESVPGWDVEEGLQCPTPTGEVICTAPEFFDGFTGADGDAPDEDYWTLYVNGTSYVEIQENTMEMYVGPVTGGAGSDYARAYFNPKISGDFDIQFDYEIVDGPSEDFWYLSFTVLDDQTYPDYNLILLARGYFGDTTLENVPGVLEGLDPVTGHQYASYRFEDPDNGWTTSALTEHTSGKMRITREGYVWTSYYWDDVEGWVQDYQHTYEDIIDVSIQIRLNHGDYPYPGGEVYAPPAKVRIDNFRVNSGTLV